MASAGRFSRGMTSRQIQLPRPAPGSEEIARLFVVQLVLRSWWDIHERTYLAPLTSSLAFEPTRIIHGLPEQEFDLRVDAAQIVGRPPRDRVVDGRIQP